MTPEHFLCPIIVKMLIDDNIFAARSMLWRVTWELMSIFLLPSFPFKATLTSYFGFNVISSTQRTGEESDGKFGSMVMSGLCCSAAMCVCVCLVIAESPHCDVHNSFITIPYLLRLGSVLHKNENFLFLKHSSAESHKNKMQIFEFPFMNSELFFNKFLVITVNKLEACFRAYFINIFVNFVKYLGYLKSCNSTYSLMKIKVDLPVRALVDGLSGEWRWQSMKTCREIT